jgi:hypothetical protein
MPIILFVLGIACVIGGVGAIVYGIPVKEFSFGNTMILAGTTSMVGGLIVIGLGAAISQLHRIVDMLGARPLARANRPLEPFEQPGGRLGAGPGRVPFPPKPKSEPSREPPEREPVVEPAPMARRAAEHDSEPEFGVPPSLRNPDVPLMAEEEAEQLPLSPRHAPPTAAPRSGLAFPERSMPPPMEPEPESGPDDEASQTSFEPNWNFPPPPPRRPPPPSNFDAMWPSEPKNPPPMAPPAGPAPSRAETVARAPTGFNAPNMSNAPQPAEPPLEDMPVGILKSGVVDGMGYTLYVDGSIEAELPDGTLRFASITELRQHLEQNS